MMNIKLSPQLQCGLSALLADMGVAFTGFEALLPPVGAIVGFITTAPVGMVNTTDVFATPFTTAFHGTK